MGVVVGVEQPPVESTVSEKALPAQLHRLVRNVVIGQLSAEAQEG